MLFQVMVKRSSVSKQLHQVMFTYQFYRYLQFFIKF